MDADLAKLLTTSLRGMFAEGGDHATALTDLGWAEVRAAHPGAAEVLLFLEQGRSLVSSPLLDGVVLAELAGLPPRPDGRAVIHPWEPDDPAAGGVLLVPPAELAEVVVATRSGGVTLASADG